jgi:hypothetical protein
MKTERRYYIGVGGTGARVAEALVHLCAAGLGPDELFLMLIDPDAGNGNLHRTTTLIRNYKEAQMQIRERAEDVALFQTNITGPRQPWTVLTDENPTLRKFISLDSLDESLKDFGKMLFSDSDLDVKLNEGFRGRPAIGAVVMSQPNTDTKPWPEFWAAIESGAGEGAAKVFVAGSVFGGTGAAGLPTFGAPSILRDRASLKSKSGESVSNIRLGACLVLPYFTFKSDKKSVEGEAGKPFMTPNDFPLATSAALHYYLTKNNLAYEDIYLIGDPGRENVGEFSAGAKNQENRPHFVELGAALSALDFYENEDRAAVDETRYFVTARTRPDHVGWDALPVSRGSADTVRKAQSRIQFQLTSAAVFFYAIASYGREILSEKDSKADWLGGKNFVLSKGDRMNPQDAAQSAMITRYVEFAERYLRWFSDVAKDPSVALLQMDVLFDSETGALRPWRSAAMGKLNSGETKDCTMPQFINQCLNAEAPPPGSSAADRYFNLFGRAANRFTEDHLKLERPQDSR